jgi:F-type H+-transporting ATPase subunit epsilon
MTTVWRAAGLTYIHYSNISARLLRQALKPEFRKEAVKREMLNIKFATWVDGKPPAKIVPNKE